MAQGKAATCRKTVTLSEATVAFMEKLAKVGTHGSDVPDVMRTLIEEGVRNAIRENWISGKLDRAEQ